MRIVLLLLPLLSSCIFGHYTSERRHQLIQSEYALTDTLHITNVFLCNSHRIEEKNVTEIPTDLDSIFSMFQSSLTRLNLPIQYHDIEYHCDEDLLKNYMKKVSKIDTNRPILVGLLQSSSHDYGNHWVLAYQYKFYDFDWVEYKVVDNHGEHAAVINSNWTMGTVRLNN